MPITREDEEIKERTKAEVEEVKPPSPEAAPEEKPDEVLDVRARPGDITRRQQRSLDAAASDVKKQLEKAKPEDRVIVSPEFNQIWNLYKQEKEELRTREMWEGFINGFGQIAAGIYGLKTGMDLSGAKFDKTNWTERMKILQGDVRARIDALKEKQRAEARAKEVAETRAIRKEERAETAAYRERVLDLRRLQLEMAHKNLKEKEALKAANELAKRDQKFRDKVHDSLQRATIAEDKEQGEVAQAHLQEVESLMKADGIPQENINEVLKEDKRWFWQRWFNVGKPEFEFKEPAEIAAPKIFAEREAPRPVEGAPEAPREAIAKPLEQQLMIAPNGNRYMIPGDKVELAKKKGWTLAQ